MYGSKSDNYEELLEGWGDQDFVSDDDEELQAINDALNNMPDDDVNEGFDEDDPTHYQVANNITSHSLGKYRKKRPFGKLYNHGVPFHQSSQLVE